MAKRLKTKRNRQRPAFKLEALEQRQLLAQIVGGSGVEVDTDVDLGHLGLGTYDQILLTGSSVSVKADPGEVVRISYLDQNGDIVQTEFSGSGTITVSLDNLKAAGQDGYFNANPDQHFAGTYTGNDGKVYEAGSQINYVQGLATITVENPELNTHLSVYSVGQLNTPGLYWQEEVKFGGDHQADIARIILVGDPTNEAGYSNFGSINANNAQFTAGTGVVGIRGENVAVHGTVGIGDINAYGAGVPTLVFNSNSQFQTVYVRGGDLYQSNGTSFDTFGSGNPGAPGGSPGIGGKTLAGFAFFESTNGQNSNGDYLLATPVNANAIRLASVDQRTVMEGDWTFDISDPSNVVVTVSDHPYFSGDVSYLFAEDGNWLAAGGLDNAFEFAFQRRTFDGDLTIVGDVGPLVNIDVASVTGTVTIDGNFNGAFTASGYGAQIGSLVVTGNLDGIVAVSGWDRVNSSTDGQKNALGSLEVYGNVGVFADVRAEEIGSIWVQHNVSGVISTDVDGDGEWDGVVGNTGLTVTDVEGKIGDISIGYDKEGASTGGSLINATIQGMSGIGNVRVGGDIWGSPVYSAFFVTQSHSLTFNGATPAGLLGYANIGNIDVKGDVDLDTATTNLIHIGHNGKYGDITVLGQETSYTTKGPQIGTDLVLIPGSETFVRILSPFTDVGFKANPAAGEAVVQNYDPDGVLGPLNSDYIVTADDVAFGAKIYEVNNDGTVGALVDAKVGDRVPVVIGGVPVIDALGNVLFYQNTALFQGQFEEVPIYGPDVVTVVSGNRGDLDGTYNHFGKIEISGNLGAQQTTTGKITWTDTVDMTFGGVSVNSAASQGGPFAKGEIGAIQITNSSGATSDFILAGVIGSPESEIFSTNYNTAFIGLNGLTINGFEDVLLGGNGGGNYYQADYAPYGGDVIIHATHITNGVNITTVSGVGAGQGPGTVSPSITVDKLIVLNNGTSEAAPQKAILNFNTGLTNSTITFTEDAGIIVANGPNLLTGSGSEIAPLTLKADYVDFDGVLRAQKIGLITLEGNRGIGSGADLAVNFTADIQANQVVGVNASAARGDVIFAPGTINAIAQNGKVAFGDINIVTTEPNSGGDITFGSGALYNANFSNITLAAGHALFLNDSGTIVDNPGHININLATSGNVGNVTATTTSGDINNALIVQGNAGNITYTAGYALAAFDGQPYDGPVGDVLRVGSITANQTIYGTRGLTTFTTAGQNEDGTAATIDFTIDEVVDYSVLPGGSVNAVLNYAGASTVSGDSLVVRTGAGDANIDLYVIGNDRNNDGIISQSELGHGGSVHVRSVAGDISFDARTPSPGTTANWGGSALFQDYIHFATLGNVTLLTGDHVVDGVIEASGNVNLSFNDRFWDTSVVPAAWSSKSSQGFEGHVGNIVATTSSGDIAFWDSQFDGNVGNVSLTAGVTETNEGLVAGSVWIGDEGPVVFNGTRGAISASAVHTGIVNADIQANGGTTVGSDADAIALSTEQGDLTLDLTVGKYDLNNNGAFTANEYGNAGNVSLSAEGGEINVNLSATEYKSANEQSKIGNVTITNQAFVEEKLGAADLIDPDLYGHINIWGGSNGAIGNLTATTDIGDITQSGTFGDIGNTTFTTGSYFDPDTIANKDDEPAVFRDAGNISFYNVVVNGTRGTSTYTVVEDGTIAGKITYGGTTTANTINASSEVGNIDLDIWVHDHDRNGNGLISANELGNAGDINLTSVAGNINLELGTRINNPHLFPQAAVPGLTFGNVTATTGDLYDHADPSKTREYFTDGAVRTYLGTTGSISATAVDTTARTGNVTITGAGDVSPNLGTDVGNRGTVGDITGDVTRGTVTLTGTFFNVGNVDLEAGTYVDQVSATNSNAHAGTVVFGGPSSAVLTINGTHGTATLHTAVNDQVGNGTVNGGNITGNVVYGGTIAEGLTDSIVANTEASDITLTVLAKSFDLDKSGQITDLINSPTQGTPIDEFAHIGNIVLTSAGEDAANSKAGNIVLNVGSWTENGSTSGSSIGDLNLTTNTVVKAVTNKGADSISEGNITVNGISSFGAGSVGDINASLVSGKITVSGDFHDVGGFNLDTGVYTDTSSNATNDPAYHAGDIALESGSNGLYISGSYQDSALSVQKGGTITGNVFVGGTGGNNWDLASDYGDIEVAFTAGFDWDNADLDGNRTTGIEAHEAGEIGDITAASNYGDVWLGLGTSHENSLIGDVSATTGDKITVEAEDVDVVDLAGDAGIYGLGGTKTDGNVGNLVVSVQTGTAYLGGTFGGVASATLTANALVDADTAPGAGEEAVVIAAGDVEFDGAWIQGTHGLVSATTVDSSLLAAGKSALAGTVAATGNISGNIIFSGALATDVTTGFEATTDRGDIDLWITAGATEGAINHIHDARETGTVGDVVLTSIDGNIEVDLHTRNVGSSIGNVTATTGDTWRVEAGADDILVASGSIEIDGNWGPWTAAGTVGNITATTLTGDIEFGDEFRHLGAVTLTTGAYVDNDTVPGFGEPPVVLAAGDIDVGATILGTHNTITLTVVDNPTPGAAVNATGNINGWLEFAGSLASGSTNSVVATSQQGEIELEIAAIYAQNPPDTDPGTAVRNETGLTVPSATTINQAGHLVGAVGNVSATSLFGDIHLDLYAEKVNKIDTESDRYSSIGNVTAKTGSSFEVQASADDLAVLEGDVEIHVYSDGIIGNITGESLSGDVEFDGEIDHIIGNINLKAGVYTDASPVPGTAFSEAGDVYFGGDFGDNANTTLGTVTLEASGAISTLANSDAGNIYVRYDIGGAWNDADLDGTIDEGEQLTFTSGQFTATVVDGQITYDVDSNGYGAKLGPVLLKSTGTSAAAGTGDISIVNSDLYVNEIVDFKVEAAAGDVDFEGSSDWSATKITNIELTSGKGDVTVAGEIGLGFADAKDNLTKSTELVNLALTAHDGNVTLSGSITADDISGYTYALVPTGTSDNRTFKFTNVTLSAANGLVDNGGVDGNILVSGLIGGAEVTSIDTLTFNVPTNTQDQSTLDSTSNNNVWAHDIGNIVFNGATKFTNAGGQINILADDSLTARSYIGSVDYSVASNASAGKLGTGSNLDTINSITFNGAVSGDTSSLFDSAYNAEVAASAIGAVIISAAVDPTATFPHSVQDLDILASNVRGAATGELIYDGYSDTDQTIPGLNDYTIGDITITHVLTAPSIGSSVFGGDNAFVGIGGLGDIRIVAQQAGNVQPTLFLTGVDSSAWFVAGDGDAELGTAATAEFTGVTSGTADSKLGDAVNGVSAQVEIGNVYIDVGSSYVPPAAQNADFGGLDAAGGYGFAIAGAVVNNGTDLGASGVAVRADAAAPTSVEVGLLAAKIGTVELLNAGIRPDADDIVNAIPATTLTGPAGVVVAAGDTANPIPNVIADIVNELIPAGVVPMTSGDFYIAGDNPGGAANVWDDNEVLVYVL